MKRRDPLTGPDKGEKLAVATGESLIGAFPLQILRDLVRADRPRLFQPTVMATPGWEN